MAAAVPAMSPRGIVIRLYSSIRLYDATHDAGVKPNTETDRRHRRAAAHRGRAWPGPGERPRGRRGRESLHRHGPADRKSTRLNSSHVRISYAVFCLKKKKPNTLTLFYSKKKKNNKKKYT